MDISEETPRKPSKIWRFLHSYFGRAVVALILIAVICTYLWWQVFAEYQKELRITKRIEAAGGVADFEGVPLVVYSFFPVHVVRSRIKAVTFSDCEAPHRLLAELKELHHIERLHIRNVPATDADLVGLQCLTRLKSLNLGNTKITDAGLEHLRGLDQLTNLVLDGTQISTFGLEKLSGMNCTKLDSLILGSTAVTDAGLEYLNGLPSLTKLHLANTKISDAGLEHLKSMPNLKVISLSDTKTTANGRADLQKSLPSCKIRS